MGGDGCGLWVVELESVVVVLCCRCGFLFVVGVVGVGSCGVCVGWPWYACVALSAVVAVSSCGFVVSGGWLWWRAGFLEPIVVVGVVVVVFVM